MNLLRLSEFQRRILGILYLSSGFFIGWYFLYLQTDETRLIGLGLMGGIIFATSLGGEYFISTEGISSGWALRNAITISFVSVFFGLLAYGKNITFLGSDCSCEQSALAGTLDNYWIIVVAIIVSYISGRTIENVEKIKNIYSRK